MFMKITFTYKYCKCVGQHQTISQTLLVKEINYKINKIFQNYLTFLVY